MRLQRRPTTAMTLIELMVVLVGIGILAGVGSIAYNDHITTAQDAAAVAALAQLGKANSDAAAVGPYAEDGADFVSASKRVTIKDALASLGVDDPSQSYGDYSVGIADTTTHVRVAVVAMLSESGHCAVGIISENGALVHSQIMSDGGSCAASSALAAARAGALGSEYVGALSVSDPGSETPLPDADVTPTPDPTPDPTVDPNIDPNAAPPEVQVVSAAADPDAPGYFAIAWTPTPAADSYQVFVSEPVSDAQTAAINPDVTSSDWTQMGATIPAGTTEVSVPMVPAVAVDSGTWREVAVVAVNEHGKSAAHANVAVVDGFSNAHSAWPSCNPGRGKSRIIVRIPDNLPNSPVYNWAIQNQANVILVSGTTTSVGELTVDLSASAKPGRIFVNGVDLSATMDLDNLSTRTPALPSCT